MLEFDANTYLLEYQDGAYLCNGKKRVEAPLNLETLEEAVKQCPKLQDVSLDDVPFGDQCFSILAKASRLERLALIRGRQMTGHGLGLLKDIPLNDLFLQRTALDDEGLFQAAQIKTLGNIYITACHQVTFDGLMAISWRDRLDVYDGEGRARLFTEKQRKAYEDARTYKSMKNQIPLDSQELQDPINALQEFFDDMTRWEEMAARTGHGNQEDIDALFSKRVSRKRRKGWRWRPFHLFWSDGGTYTNYRLIVGERVTKNEYWIYAEEGIFYGRFLLRFIDGKWMIDTAQYCRQGIWLFCEL